MYPNLWGCSEMIKLSICMIVKNAESDLQRCLDSILPLINMKDDDTLEPLSELIIIDTGSTDRTVNIAKKYTDKVFIKEFVPWSFSDARNYGIAMAKGKRIFIIDSDHELQQSGLYILMNAVLNPAYDEFKTMFLKIHNLYSTETGEYAEMTQSLIFENTGKPLYEFSIHNRAKAQPPYLFLDNVILNHYGYLFQKQDLFLQKKERSLPMLEAEYDKNPDDLHILTHIIKTYYACLDHKNVIEKGKRWMKLMRKVQFHDGWFAYLEVFNNILASYCALKDTKNAVRVFKEAQKYTVKLIPQYLILGQHYLENQEHEKARELFEEAYLLSKQPLSEYEKLCSNNTAVIMPEILNLLATIEFSDGNYLKAGRYLNEGILLNQNRLPLRWDIFNDSVASKQLIDNGFKKKRAS